MVLPEMAKDKDYPGGQNGWIVSILTGLKLSGCGCVDNALAGKTFLTRRRRVRGDAEFAYQTVVT